MKPALIFYSKTVFDIPKMFSLIQKGLLPQDRAFINMMFGICKNPFVVNGRGIAVDISHQSSSGNFNVLKKIASEPQANTELRFVVTSEGIDSNYASLRGGKIVLTPSRQTKYFNGKDFSLTPNDFAGWTTYPVDNPPSITDYPVYSTEPITQANVLINQLDINVVVTIYHELRAHVLSSKIGRNPSLGSHGLPLVEAEARSSEAEVRANFYK